MATGGTYVRDSISRKEEDIGLDEELKYLINSDSNSTYYGNKLEEPQSCKYCH